MAGSRSGAVIAAAWASLLAIGREGFVAQAERLLELTERLCMGIENVPYLKLLGQPDSTVVAFGAFEPEKLDIYRVNDAMTAMGWHLSALQRPAGLHMCLTPAHSEKLVDQLVKDLMKACVQVMRATTGDEEEGMAPIYGMAEALPDRHIIGDVLVAFQEASLDI